MIFLKQLIEDTQLRTVTIDLIIESVCDRYNVSQDDLLSKKRSLQDAGVREDAEEYARNPLLAGFDAGVAVAPVLAGEDPKSKKNRAIKKAINKKERKAIKEAGKYINPITLVGLA